MPTEYPKGYIFSSAAYVSAVVKVKERKEDWRKQRLPLRRVVKQCDHKSTICPRCWKEWAQDYELLLEATVGGRWLDDNKIA
jgi:hypothetical protein